MVSRLIAGKSSRSAFTLIELLIVIAIIAILALIAVPNFLEAQTRAKVSRAHSDMRSIANAIEAYAVDWGLPPPDWRTLNNSDCSAISVRWEEGISFEFSCMTTPVAFITSLPLDPFRDSTEKYKGYRYLNFSCRYLNDHGGPDSTAQPYSKHAKKLGYVWSLTSIGPSRKGATLEGPDNAPPAQTQIQDGPWDPRVLVGPGPAPGVPWDAIDYPVTRLDVAYDPSNGTLSKGIIPRTNKGAFGGKEGS